MYFYAQGCLQTLGLTIIFQDIPLEPWRDGLFERGLAFHQVNCYATMADPVVASRTVRMSDDVLTLTEHGSLNVLDFVRKTAATFHRVCKEGLSLRPPANRRKKHGKSKV